MRSVPLSPSVLLSGAGAVKSTCTNIRSWVQIPSTQRKPGEAMPWPQHCGWKQGDCWASLAPVSMRDLVGLKRTGQKVTEQHVSTCLSMYAWVQSSSHN